jgi:hypothetical protein
MTPHRARDAALDESLAGLSRMDASPGHAEALRGRMHHELARKSNRRLPRNGHGGHPGRLTAEAAVAATVVLLYLVGVVRQALDFYGQ